jgi:hypothetical protein
MFCGTLMQYKFFSRLALIILKFPLYSPINTISVKSAHAMWKVLMVQSCEGLAVANPPQTQNPLFFSWRDWRL